MPVCGVRTFIIREYTDDFTDATYKSKCHHGKQAIEVARLVSDGGNDCKFGVRREEHRIHSRPTLSTAVWESLLECCCFFYCSALALDVIQVLDGS